METTWSRDADVCEFGHWSCAPWGTGGTVEVVEIGALLPAESAPLMFGTAPVSPYLREFGHSTCPPGGTGGNFGDGRDRSASLSRVRTTHVRHSTRLGGSSCCGAGTTASTRLQHPCCLCDFSDHYDSSTNSPPNCVSAHRQGSNRRRHSVVSMPHCAL